MPTIYLDECKQVPYLLVGVLVEDFQKVPTRKKLSSLLLKGQRSIHFKNENERYKKLVLSELRRSKYNVVVFRVAANSDSRARRATLVSLVSYALEMRVAQMVFELDESAQSSDEKILANCVPMKDGRRLISWEHRLRHQEPLLWVADAVAWCVNRGGEWERMVRPMIIETIDC